MKLSGKILLVGGLSVLAFFLLKKRKTKTNDNDSDPNPNVPPVTPSDTITKLYIGKGAYAITDSTYVRNDAYVNNSTTFDPINNIIGVLGKDEFAGIIEKVVVGKYDGKYWYYVNKGVNYNCPFMICGFTFPAKKGWIRSDVVTLK
jgi:hypothetical protein